MIPAPILDLSEPVILGGNMKRFVVVTPIFPASEKLTGETSGLVDPIPIFERTAEEVNALIVILSNNSVVLIPIEPLISTKTLF